MNCLHPPCQVDSTQKKENYAKFVKFNVILLGIIIFAGLMSILIPKSNLKITSRIILDHILPLLYFAIFSFLFGAMFLIGNDDMKNYLLEHFSNKTLDIGIIASYCGGMSIILSIFIKNIIQKLLNVAIMSSPQHDVFGFMIGRVFLLLTVYFFNLQ